MSVKVKNTTVSGGLSGKDETISKTFAHKNGKSYSSMKKFTKPANPSTPAQQVIRNAFTQFSIGWSQLTQAQRDAWNADAPNWVNTDIFGTKQQSGQNLYIGCNVALSVHGMDNTDVPLSKDFQTTINELNVTFAGGVIQFDGDLANIVPEERVSVSVSAPKSMGSSKVTKLTTLGSYPCNQVFPVNLTADYIAKYGAIPAGKKIFVETKYISLGGNVGGWAFQTLLT